MTTPSEPSQAARESQLPARERAELLLDRVLEQKIIWGLMGAEGWVMVESGKQTCLPVWPDEASVAFWQRKDLPDSKPEPIALDEFTSVWLQGLKKNNIAVVLFPSGNLREGIVSTADELLLQLTDINE
ncbi:DUF2750 domain-containing protein [Alteromonas gilva]|uniref:DUF2750 domain-containing protein n=1 Tax=Alteromonas gilva TaxID=2987522 RepID=A0ABT5L4G8_9ALTE|nr:DUF2750 domain-containing protein [Alteromonas gilva]MDC8831324.1 DUF2750 domain-containing protein [Alteromonas gilva]